MDPRMIGKGTLVPPENEFPIRNPWIPLTQDQIHSRSNGVSIDRNGNQLRTRNPSEFFELLNRCSEQTPNYNGAGNSVNLSAQPNQSRGSYSMSGHMMGNGILTSGSSSNPTAPLNQSGGSYSMSNYQMGNRIFTSGNRSNLTVPLNQSSGSSGLSNQQMGHMIFTSGNRSNLTVPLNQSGGSSDLSNYQRGNRILEGGNNFNLNRSMNQSSSSNGMVNLQRGNGILTSGYSSNFTRPPNQSSGSYNRTNSQMGNGNLGTYLNSQTQSNHNDILAWRNVSTGSNRGLIANTVQQQLSYATDMPLNMVLPKTDAVISSTTLNLNMRPLSSPRGMNLPNAPSILNAYSEVDSSWTEGNFTSLLLGDEIPELGPNKWSQSNISPQILNHGFQDHIQQYNLNSPPRPRGNGGTSNANTFPFAPITPDHTNLLEKHRQAQMLKFLVDDIPCQEDKLENLVLSIGKETIENHCSELLETIAGPSASGVSAQQTENNITEDKNDPNVINLNETPQQKTPKRRKHRPKVVIEGKPKRTPKAKTPNDGESEKNPAKKRKYVRKNTDPDAENTTPQQTNVINTDEDPHFEYQKESCKKRLNFDFEKSEDENQHTEAKIQLAHHEGQQVLDLNLSFSANQMLVKSLAGEESHALTTPSEITNDNPLNIIARNSSMRNKENRANRNVKGESKKNISRANLNLEKSREMRWKSTHQMVERDVGNFKGFCGSNGEDSQLTEQEGPSSENKELISPKDGDSNEETRKKQKTENDHQTAFCVAEEGSNINGTSGESKIIYENYVQRKRTAANLEMVPEEIRKNIPSKSNQVHNIGNFAVMKNSNLQSPITSKKTGTSGYQQKNENYQASMQNNKPHMTANPCREVSFCTNEVPLQESDDALHQYRQLSKTKRGRPKVVKYSMKVVDEITVRLQRLSISDKNGEKDRKDNYALVPYGGGGAVVPYVPKKRKPRPKVDLDPETNRIWNLLMGKEGAEASQGENRDKEKWWEEERRVFHGRAESFIARMHLVQGNRRFSPWKGSVVDSIIGVFLTQNVSDQLSSSAFMALAAQFPLGSATTDHASDQSGTSILTEENISSSQNSSSGSSSEPESSSNGGKPINTSTQHEYITTPLQVAKNSENNGGCLDDSSMRYYKQTLESDQNKQIQGSDLFTNFNTFSPLNHSIGSNISSMQNSDIPLSYFQLLMAPQVERSEADCCEISREECRSSFPPKAPEMEKGKRISYQANLFGHTEDIMGKTLLQQNGLKNSQTQNLDPFEFLMNHLTVKKSSVHQVHQNGPLSLNTHQVERSQVYESEHTGFQNLSGMGEQVVTGQSGAGNQVPGVPNHTGQTVDNQEGTSAVDNQVSLGDIYEKNIGVSAKTLKTSQKHDKARESFDWDSLRKTVMLNGGVKERSVDASDSMDYEAMRCADVNVISNSIRIRGMNNMLSERIQDFLNRVVVDHGSIDLEWLRDVPPDKAKDYLLSIRGLGLKSVECVRLLTLHHLAFPVDTNVGRIAVRLGWVPLQPLPESLQLHLLEMYPVLETVQKYLWPRLCKLDQKTLYELHYQLITFGKVFCTKSKPNCNACPMRGECRHFASAFASARLALPAPEDKSIVGSTMPIPTGRSAGMPMNPMLLQLPGSNGEREMMVSRCEPIIEEPASPEPEIAAIEETDIEDAFYEDPDEIPTIRLNVEQLAVNLRNFMEEHTDLQEEDMSKALVALAPEAASIPAPKLKYVLRLRTERQVYVLTDAHPLVEGLDKREPDDPSPYLLALLAPGEETGSDQPSGRSFESSGPGEPCNEKERNSSTVKGTLLIPCRTAMRGSFPLNGTYFQVNEVFADHESSLNPIDVPREWLWHLETRTVFFGTSATSIFRGMTTKEIQNTCWRGFVCVRGFDQKTRAPRPLNRNLHLTQNKTVKTSNAAK